MRAGTALMAAFVALQCLSSCRFLADSDVTYCDVSNYRESFPPAAEGGAGGGAATGDAGGLPGTTLELLGERCWRYGNEGELKDERFANIFPDDGDLIVQAAPALAAGDEWPHPVAFQQLEGDFVVATRVEAVHQTNGDHCFMSEDSMVGLVVRHPGQVGSSSFLIGPFMPEDPPDDLDCTEGSTSPYPTRAVVRSSDLDWGDPFTDTGIDQAGIAFDDSEADIAICALDGVLQFYYRDPQQGPDDPPEWLSAGKVGDAIPSHAAGAGGTWEVGLTAVGSGTTFEVEGHFTSVVYINTIGGDGCRGALEELRLPEDEP